MPARKTPDPNAKPQSERFIEMARELGCDEDEEAFKRSLGKVPRHKTTSTTTKRKPSEGASSWDENSVRSQLEATYTRLDREREQLWREAQKDPLRIRWHDDVKSRSIVCQLIYQTDCLSSPEALNRKLDDLADPAEWVNGTVSEWFKQRWERQIRAIREEFFSKP